MRSARARGGPTVLITIVLGLGLTAYGIATAFTTARAGAIESIDRDHVAVANVQRHDIEDYFERARSIMLISAENPSFADFYASHEPRAQRVAEGGKAVSNVVDALEYLERLYPKSIGEACFIDAKGPENARVVRSKIANANSLSTDESSNPFFAATIGLAPGQVYHAAPYVSPDTGEWVISNSTPVVGADGQTSAIVHFEVTLESFRAELSSASHETAIIDGKTGAVLAINTHPQRLGDVLGQPNDKRFMASGAVPTRGSKTIGGHRFAFAAITRSPSNANAWTIAVGTKKPLGTFIGFGQGQIAIIAFGILIAGVGAYTARAHSARLKQAMIDDLTGLPSRRQLLDAGAAALEEQNTKKKSCAVLMIDLDRFKDVNDTLGHSKGDELLRAVATRLTEALRDSAVLARLGGDEFGVLVEGPTSVPDTVDLGLRLHDVIDEPFEIGGLMVHVGASIGIALAPDHGTDIESLLQHADVAMYESKRTNRPVTVYEPSADPHSAARLTQATELRAAIRDRKIELHYQPKVEVATGRTVGVEALARWTDRSGRRIPPDHFIPLAERCGLMATLTQLVIDIGLGQLGNWRDAGLELTMAINVSATSLLEPTFVSDVAAAMRRHHIPPRSIVLELTETAIMDDPSRAMRVLEELRRIGVSLSIDDFGTGYSSLDYLRRLPVNELKIDKTFVDELSDGDRLDGGAIVKATIEMGHSLGMRIVAEGVEVEHALSRLGDLGCDQVQGYLLSRPLTADAATDWLLANPVEVRRGIASAPDDASGLSLARDASADPVASSENLREG